MNPIHNNADDSKAVRHSFTEVTPLGSDFLLDLTQPLERACAVLPLRLGFAQPDSACAILSRLPANFSSLRHASAPHRRASRASSRTGQIRISLEAGLE